MAGDTPPDNKNVPDDQEMAAILGAIAAFMRIKESRKGRESKQTQTQSAWARTARMEGAGIQPDESVDSRSSRNLWRNFPAVLLACLSLNLVSPCSGNPLADDSGCDVEEDALVDATSAEASKPGGYQEPSRSRTLPDVLAQFIEGSNCRSSRQSKKIIRVALSENVSRAAIETPDGATVYETERGELVAILSPSSKWKLACGPSSIVLNPQRPIDSLLIAKDSKSLAGLEDVVFQSPLPLSPQTDSATKLPPAFTQMLKVVNKPKPGDLTGSATIPATESGLVIVPGANGDRQNSRSLFSVNGKMYRGSLWVRPTVSKNPTPSISTINLIELEEYLASVLPSEMPSGWPLEALKAQAIACRSYVLANRGKYNSCGFDVKANVSDQMYLGVMKESESACQAIKETAGIIIKHNGAVVSAFFHSSAGGHTEVAQHVWSKPVPYLQAVPDFDVKSKHILWERELTRESLEKALGFKEGTLTGVFTVARSPSRRVTTVMAISDQTGRVFSGHELRRLCNLPSTNFNVCSSPGAYIFRGQGFGHGLGMSQWGARALAEHGYNAAQILKYYYKDITFDYAGEASAL
ncbi:MAG: SpoIID/LytB domain-containing protein [Cyanobacteria bacterium]|nr:SpoIID/LytB domain-containing protein [Cyanobacteriota bacterium]